MLGWTPENHPKIARILPPHTNLPPFNAAMVTAAFSKSVAWAWYEADGSGTHQTGCKVFIYPGGKT